MSNTTKRTVRLFRPHVGAEELEAVKGTFDRAWLGLGPKVGELEQTWSTYIGANETVGLNSATAALHMSLYAFGFKEGAKVLVPSMTFVSTATAALYNRLEPVFVDADPNTLCLDIKDLERKWTPDCVAILPVHFGGYPADMERILAFAKEKNLKVVEDCAHCAGGSVNGKKLGTFGDIGCFSFEEKKCMTSGDGGVMCSDDKDLLAPIRAARWVGIDKDTWKRAASYTDKDALAARHWYYEIALLGYKYNMNDLAASIALVQLAKLDAMNKSRSESIARYLEGIKDLKSVAPLLPYDLKEHSYWIFGIRPKERDRLIAFLKERGIATGVHYMPLPMHPLFKDNSDPIPVAAELWEQFVTLPLYSGMEQADVDYVIEGLRDFDKMA